MIEMACRLCRHWGEKSEVADIRKCARPKQFWSATEYRKVGERKVVDSVTGQTVAEPTVERFLVGEAKGDMMFVQDASDYRAELLTHADFFCAHYEEPG